MGKIWNKLKSFSILILNKIKIYYILFDKIILLLSRLYIFCKQHNHNMILSSPHILDFQRIVYNIQLRNLYPYAIEELNNVSCI